jgi:DNA-directed RNA polymerase
MRRDKKGMYWSNLFPAKDSSEPPQDAYREVIRVAIELASKNPETAWMRKFIKNRKLGKAILMKKIYGASLQTNRADVKAALIEDGLYPAPFSYAEANQLTKLLTVASEIVFPRAFEALDWILKLYKAAVKNGSESFTWETPTYDSIHLIEQSSDTVLVRTTHLGNVTIGTGLNKTPDYLSMKGALPPSFVHSYDAAVLKASFKDWKKPLAVIHDCINVLPKDMESAMDRVRKGFVHVCDGDPLAKLADDLGVSDKQLKRLPQGDADLGEVLLSTYMMN